MIVDRDADLRREAASLYAMEPSRRLQLYLIRVVPLVHGKVL